MGVFIFSLWLNKEKRYMKEKFKLLLHMPHVSLKVPKYFYKGLLISKEEFNKYNLKNSDVLLDHLFKNLKGIKIKPKYSRMALLAWGAVLFCEHAYNLFEKRLCTAIIKEVAKVKSHVETKTKTANSDKGTKNKKLFIKEM